MKPANAWPRLIAVDGPAGAGKGTLADRLCRHFNLAKLDTGLLYRAVGYSMLRSGLDPDDAAAAAREAKALDPALLDDPALRGDDAAGAASKVSAVPAVRAALLDFQRGFADNPPGDVDGAVLDGRDIGTVVCPDADVKLFVTAPLDIRAERRFKELQAKGEAVIYARVFEDMKARDERDQGRNVSPMKAAEDAFELDTGDLDADGVFAEVMAFIESKSPRLRG